MLIKMLGLDDGNLAEHLGMARLFELKASQRSVKVEGSFLHRSLVPSPRERRRSDAYTQRVFFKC